MKKQKIVCMEASLVWKHADFGLVPLRDFLRIAEDSGSIVTIGEWLLRNACEQFQKWKLQEFYPESLAINISIRQLENSHFSYKLSLILQELNLDPANLILEISEWVLLKKSDMVEKNLHMLNRLGIQVGISDFGAGNIALQQLKSFPLSYLKITNDLVKDITIDKESVAIVNMIIVLAKTLQLKVVADGVESQKQKQVLNELGCYLMQGDFFGAPILAEEFTSLLEGPITESV
jgi:EAL domain-containing protein (putative c-di-GMP-specific phosphodiesterase class I)